MGLCQNLAWLWMINLISKIIKMKLLCIGNGIFTGKPGKLLTHKHIGEFLIELTRYFEEVTFAQALFDRPCNETLNDFELSSGKLEAFAVHLKDKNILIKCYSYLKAIPPILRQIRNVDCLYVFLPGNLSVLFSICAIVFRKSYGVYLRGELGIDTKLVRLILSNADFVHANGGFLADKAHRFCRDVELTVPMLDLTTRVCITRKNFKSQPPWNILYVGRIEVRKGIYELIEAARILKERNIDFKLNIVGDGPELKRLKTETPEELRENVRFLGLISNRNRLFSLYMNADLFVLPSHDEGFPRVLYEAMAFQAPIITTFVGSIGSILEHEVNCLRIDVRNTEMIALMIERALRDVNLRQKIAHNAGDIICQILKNTNGKSHARQVQEKLSKYAKE
jgi:glycosyltransferase involved in cell wall biosynthesis